MNTRRYSNSQEKRVAKQLKGKKQPNSGATAFFKGDIITEDFLIECKTMASEKKSISIKKEWIDKNREEAFAMNRRFSAVGFNFGGYNNPENFYIIDEDTMRLLIELINKDKKGI